MPKEVLKYERRVIAYIDILGFKQIVDDTIMANGRPSQPRINWVLEVYKIFNITVKGKFSGDVVNDYKPQSMVVTYFSDTIVISVKYNDKHDASRLIHFVKMMQATLADRGIFCRGAITVGKIIHTKSIIFGPGLIDAYTREKNDAIFPRIIIDQKLAKRLIDDCVVWVLGIHGAFFFKVPKEVVKEDEDGQYYIDYFVLYTPECREFTSSEQMFHLLNSVRLATVNEIAISHLKDDKHIMKKYQWMRRKYNEALKLYKEEYLEFLEMVPGVSYEYCLKIKRLKTIDELEINKAVKYWIKYWKS
ncbi:hypothetical protein [Pedobacter sp. UC225_65]|uniref:hypothetical protein n=1 Tax=Pedobacter sp. UC225_65 TaxID=3350173 RepID=UPI00366B993A